MQRRNFIQITSGAGAGMLLPKSLKSGIFMKSTEESVDNLVIGSGYGGAVAALRLTQAGKKVLMLEMGLDWNKEERRYKPFSNMVTPKNNSTWLRKSTIAPMMNISQFNHQFTGVLDRMDFENIKVYAGRGVGGGSLVNGGMAVQPKRDYFEKIFPQLNAREFWDKYFPLAQNELGMNEISSKYFNRSDYYKFSRVGESEAFHAGFKTVRVPNVYSFDYMEKEEAGKVPKSALAKEVIYGNNFGKKSLDKSYLAKALKTGFLTIAALHKAKYIEVTATGYKVITEVINTSGEKVSEKVIHCRNLFLNAGSLGTTRLLLASQFKGNFMNLNEHLGKYWGNNGNVMTGRNMVNTVFNRVKKKGGNANFKIGTGVRQSGIPVSGIDNWADEFHSFFAEISPLPMGLEVYTALYLVINQVPLPGSISFDEKTDNIQINWEEKNYQHTLENAKYFIRRMNAANGGTPAGLLWKGGYGTDICYHPLGGVVLGKATDDYGRVKGYKNLYVTDGALVPASIGVNPFLTITALAEHCMENILQNDYTIS